MKRKKIFGILLGFCVLILESINASAQIGPVPPPGGSVPGTEQGIPVDGGITILVAAGIGFGVKKIKDARQNNKVACKQFEEK